MAWNDQVRSEGELLDNVPSDVQKAQSSGQFRTGPVDHQNLRDLIVTLFATAGTDPNAIHDNVANEIHQVTQKATPVAADEVLVEDSADTWNKKRVALSAIPATDSDAIHDNVDGEINAVAVKGTPVAADIVLIEDSAASFAKKKATLSSLPTTDSDAIHDNVAGEIHAVTQKATPVAADEVLIEDSADTWNKKRVALSAIPATDSDAIHDNVAGEIHAITQKATPVGADEIVIEDSADSWNKKRVAITDLPGGDSGFEYDSTNKEVQSTSTVVTDAADFVHGSQSLDDSGGTGDSRMLFDKSKYAFRAGYVQGTEWDDASRGIGSVCFGYGTKADDGFAFASGQNTLADQRGMYSHGGDSFASGGLGNAQYSRATLLRQTTDATPTELSLVDTSLERLFVGTNKSWTFRIFVIARQTGGIAGTVGDSGGYEIIGVVKNISGTLTLVGTPTVTTIAEDDAAWSVAIGVTGNEITLTVTGAADKTIRWVGSVHITQVA